MPHTFIIAEAGVNHNGSVEDALRMVDAAADAGADAVKFQTFQASKLATHAAPKAAYQKKLTDADESQLSMLEKLQLNEQDYATLAARCAEKNIEFISSPFDIESVEILVRCGVGQLKIPSGEITNGPLLLSIAATSLPCILSTGMATLGEVETALAILSYGYKTARAFPHTPNFLKGVQRNDFEVLKGRVSLLHCTSLYPTPFSDVNLHCVDTLRRAFGLKVGYSDHTIGTEISLAAVALGCEIVEKHFTLSRDQEGPDHKASLEPQELRNLVTMIRNVEQSLGSSFKFPTELELGTRAVARKGVVAATGIQEGEKFHADNLAIKRPESGVSPLMYWNLLGRSASKSYSEDDPLIED